jgi:hypothetical protein
VNVGDEAAIDLELWLTRGALAARRGDLVTSRRIFRALSRLAPTDRRVWIGLARVAESVAERTEALQRAECTTAHLPLPPVLLRTEDVSTTTVSVAPPPPPESVVTATQPAPLTYRSWWRLALLLVLPGLLAVWWLVRVSVPETASVAPPTVSAIGPLPTPPTDGAVVTVPAITPSPPPPTLSPALSPSSGPDTRSFGQFVIHENWRIALLRPEDAVIVDGELGTIHANGHLLVALLAVSNEAPVERALPPNLFAVEDEMGQRHHPLPGASTDYLEQFGRGMYGDLALEDRFTPQSGLRSVPVLFELPRNRKPLRLWVGDDSWWLR